MNSAVRPFRLFPESASTALHEALLACLAQWMREWGMRGAGADLSLRLLPASALSTSGATEWTHIEAASGVEAWAAVSKDGMRALHAALFGEQHALACRDKEQDYSWSAAGQARDQLFTKLFAVLAADGAQKTAQVNAVSDAVALPGSGSIEIGIGAFELRMVAGGPLFELPASATESTASRSAARIEDFVREQPVQLDVMVGSVEIELSRLLELSAGDVVLLDARVDEPLQLRGPSATPLARCALGQRDGHRAIQLAP